MQSCPVHVLRAYLRVTVLGTGVHDLVVVQQLDVSWLQDVVHSELVRRCQAIKHLSMPHSPSQTGMMICCGWGRRKVSNHAYRADGEFGSEACSCMLQRDQHFRCSMHSKRREAAPHAPGAINLRHSFLGTRRVHASLGHASIARSCSEERRGTSSCRWADWMKPFS